MAPAKKLLALALLSALVILAAEAATHSKRRGLKVCYAACGRKGVTCLLRMAFFTAGFVIQHLASYVTQASGLTDEEISEVLKQHDPHRVIHRHNNKDDLKVGQARHSCHPFVRTLPLAHVSTQRTVSITPRVIPCTTLSCSVCVHPALLADSLGPNTAPPTRCPAKTASP